MISYMFNTDMNSTEIQDFKKQTKKTKNKHVTIHTYLQRLNNAPWNETITSGKQKHLAHTKIINNTGYNIL